METWYTRVRMPDGSSVPVSCQAISCGQAKAIFESQYPKQNILHLPGTTPR